MEHPVSRVCWKAAVAQQELFEMREKKTLRKYSAGEIGCVGLLLIVSICEMGRVVLMEYIF